MRTHQIMVRKVITVGPTSGIVDAANIMLKNHISGLPVIDGEGKLVGIISQGDFIRRAEIGTERKRARWLEILLGSGRAASEFVRERGRNVGEIMTPNPTTVTEDTPLEDVVQQMEKHSIKRLPVMRGDQLVGIITRSNLLQAVAELARDIPDSTSDDDHIRDRIVASIEKNDWAPFRLNIIVRGGNVSLAGTILDERSREASIVAAENVEGVKQVHDYLCWVDPMSGLYMNSGEDEALARAN